MLDRKVLGETCDSQTKTAGQEVLHRKEEVSLMSDQLT